MRVGVLRRPCGRRGGTTHLPEPGNVLGEAQVCAGAPCRGNDRKKGREGRPPRPSARALPKPHSQARRKLAVFQCVCAPGRKRRLNFDDDSEAHVFSLLGGLPCTPDRPQRNDSGQARRNCLVSLDKHGQPRNSGNTRWLQDMADENLFRRERERAAPDSGRREDLQPAEAGELQAQVGWTPRAERPGEKLAQPQ
jgi:hypothetical protein